MTQPLAASSSTNRAEPIKAVAAAPGGLRIEADVLASGGLLSGVEKIVYSHLRASDPETDLTLEEHARACGEAISTFRRALKRLQTLGLVAATRPGQGQPNRYYIRPVTILKKQSKTANDRAERRRRALAIGRERYAEQRDATTEPSEPETQQPLFVQNEQTTPASPERPGYLSAIAERLHVSLTGRDLRNLDHDYGAPAVDLMLADWHGHLDTLAPLTNKRRLFARLIRDCEPVPTDLKVQDRPATPRRFTLVGTPPPLDDGPSEASAPIDLAIVPIEVVERAHALGMLSGSAQFNAFVRASIERE